MKHFEPCWSKLLCINLLLALVCLLPSAGLGEDEPAVAGITVADILRERLEIAGLPAELAVSGERMMATKALPEFYLERFFAPAWVQGFAPGKEALELLKVLKQVRRDGLHPDHYHVQALQDLWQEIAGGKAGPEQLADLELLLTDAFLVLASHYWHGRINSVTIDAEWHALRNDFNPVPILDKALAGGDIKGALLSLLPEATEYWGLREALSVYREIADNGGWPTLPEGTKLIPGDRSSIVPLLRTRLIRSGDYTPCDLNDQDLYDTQLVDAVKRFQQRHGLLTDGVLGKGTLSALNISATDRVHQIEVNLERWRWLPRDLGEQYILVNIAAFHLYVVEHGMQVLDMKVVVGRPYRRTPVFSGLMTSLVLNPYWNVPRIIATEDYIPQMRNDPDYLSRLGIKVYQGWGAEVREIDPQTINWRTASEKNFPYHLRQEPGGLNALGRIKFMFPNPFDVYLHDTPTRELFHKESRPFSSGCIRLEHALELASYLLKGTAWETRGALLYALKQDKTRTIRLPRPYPVHLLYWTAWVDHTGKLNFRPDIYERDGLLGRALANEPPKP